ncbi:potassium/proton antiporter membrane subunit (CPA2 family) [Stackebrandtia endophytica]|uniref:Potassium/proton antiporter membrane subunit (CPA2 family) n=1 Tax=Stackebrandtia endophytica TaxID=1496996 RepID=A0A543B3I9_9ACTN|nr:cation:proton antiporter [Stackebrandtia endophytica]TQL79384.1 potassium/proton antiporter membrane subunit (CPA2 family) [Stackebrandtia endophytica]
MAHIALVLIELGAVILGLGILSAIAGRFGISPIPLYLLAGLGFGIGGVTPLAEAEEFIAVGAEVGVVLLLFMLGLEYTTKELFGTLRKGAPIGLLDIVLNATPGVAVALLLGWGPIAAMVMGGVTLVTSSGVTAKVLGDLGWLGNRETPTVLSVLVMEDLVMAIYLPIVTTMLAGLALAQASIGLAVAAVAVTAALLIAAKFGGVVERFLSSPSNEILVLKVLGLILLVAGLAEQVHVSAAVGAFLVGITLSGEIAQAAHKILDPLKDVFAALFFVHFGLMTNPSDLPPVLVIAGILAVVGAGTKLITGLVAARRAGIGKVGAWRTGVLLMSRGEFSIVIAGLAVSAPALADVPGINQLGPLVAAYVLILVIVGPLAARMVEPLAKRFIVKKRQQARAEKPTASVT